MSDLEIDLGAVSIPDNHHVYKCFPGQSYRFYQSTIEQSAVFLDIHDLQSLGGRPAGWNGDALLKVVAASREREEARLNARNPDRKRRSARASRKLDIRNVTLAMGLYVDAKPGDLVVVPAEGYKKDVYVGELLDADLISVEIGGDDDRLPQTFLGRRVSWRARRPKKDFGSKLINQLQNPTAFFDVGRQSYEEIYRLAYENYIFGDYAVSTFETSKDKFRNSDNLVVSLWFEYLIASGIAKDDARVRTH